MDATKKVEFKEIYEKAKSDNLMSFMFEGEEYSMGYANYILKFPENNI